MLSTIKLQNYRNLNGTFTLGQHNLVIAPNGSGKSNLLESLYVSALGRSFKPTQDYADLIGPDSNFAKVTLTSDQNQWEMVVSQTERLQRKYLFNQKSRPLSKVIGTLPLLVFAPHAVDIATGEPGIRRQDLDDFLILASPEYASAYTRYQQVLKNRNALLKFIREQNSDPFELAFWDNELVRLAEIIHRHRRKFFTEIAEYVGASAKQIYSNTEINFGIEYLGSLSASIENYAQILADKLTANRSKEIIVGKTLYGPHKDDYQLLMDGKNLRYLGSRGQQRLAVFIWKLAQLNYLEALSGKSVLLLIDDLMSELDEQHRYKVATFLLSTPVQTLLTAADPLDVPSILVSSSTNILVTRPTTAEILPE